MKFSLNNTFRLWEIILELNSSTFHLRGSIRTSFCLKFVAICLVSHVHVNWLIFILSMRIKNSVKKFIIIRASWSNQELNFFNYKNNWLVFYRTIDLESFNSLVIEAYALERGEMKHNNTKKSNKGGSGVSRKIDVAERG